jgi:hypothetical protein
MKSYSAISLPFPMTTLSALSTEVENGLRPRLAVEMAERYDVLDFLM